MSVPPVQFSPHGSSRFERHGQVLLLYSQGPFNAEHVLSLAPAFREHAAELMPQGPWVSINIVGGSIMSTPEAVAALRRSAQFTLPLGRVALAYVAPPTVEGRRLMEAPIRASYQDLLPCEFFDQLESAMHWARNQIARVAGSNRD